MADETKRVIDQTTDSSLSAGDYVIVDSQSEGTRKFDLGTELTDIKQDLQPVISFKAVGKISEVISNVKVYGGGTIKYAITNINNNFNGFSGVVVYTVNGSTFSSALTITLPNTQGTYAVQIGREAIEFDYNLDNMATGTRITSQDDTAIIKDSCYVSESSYVTTSAIARIISNVRILTPASVTYYLGYASRNDSIAIVQIYSSANSYAKLNNINIGIGKGHISEKIADGAWITFDYDMSWTSTGVNYGNFINGQTQIKSSCVTEVVEKAKNPYADIFASAGLFETMGVVGDSYASGQIWKQVNGTWTATNCWPISWIQIMARNFGNTATNFSFGGLTTRTWLTAERGKTYMESESAKQLYFLCLGINDVNALGMDYLGSGADYNTGADTFYGNYSTIIRAIQAHAPNAKIIMFTTPFTSNSTYVAYNNAIIAIAQHFGLPYVEQYLHPFIASSDYTSRLQNGHPTAVMYSGMAKAYEELLADCLYNNVNYFKEYLG
jgi:lysophospholipase L1-like esterase